MLSPRKSSKFKKDYKRVKSQNHDVARLQEAVEILARGETLPNDYKDHALIGNWAGYRECHLGPDWLLIYKIKEDELLLARLGSHSELFGK